MIVGAPATSAMRRAFAALVLGGVLLSGSPGVAQTLPLRLLRDYLEALRIQAGIPGLSVALVGPDGVFWEGAFGRQNMARALATRVDTPFHIDGLTQLFTTTLVLRCVEEGRLSLDDRIDRFKRDSPDANATIREVLTHTSPGPGGLAFNYRLERLEPLEKAIRSCTDNSYRESLTGLLDQIAMRDSVPGADIVGLVPPAEGIPDAAEVARYAGVLERLATPYTVDAQRRAFPAAAASPGLTAASGIVTTALDLAAFDQALRRGILLRPETLAEAWTPALAGNGRALPHGMGWFSQVYNGERIVWQFGLGATGSSSLMVTVPARGYTFILLANSTGLVKQPPISVNDLMLSPFVRLLLGFSPSAA
jgi:CubicO group peptidase (beta-lactamase class C family)